MARLPASLSDVEFTPEELIEVKIAASIGGQTLQEFLRAAVQEYVATHRHSATRTVDVPATEVKGFPFYLRSTKSSSVWPDEEDCAQAI